MGRDDEAKRLVMAREAAGYGTAEAAAEAMGVNSVTYRAHENGTNGYRRSVQRYADFFGVTMEWLISGKGPRVARKRDIDLIGHVGAGGEVYGIDGDTVGSRIDGIVPANPDEVVAVTVRGVSQWPRYVDGETILIDRDPCTLDQAHGRYAVITCQDGRHLLKRVLVERPGIVTLESHNAPPEYHVPVESVRRVRGTLS